MFGYLKAAGSTPAVGFSCGIRLFFIIPSLQSSMVTHFDPFPYSSNSHCGRHTIDRGIELAYRNSLDSLHKHAKVESAVARAQTSLGSYLVDTAGLNPAWAHIWVGRRPRNRSYSERQLREHKHEQSVGR